MTTGEFAVLALILAGSMACGIKLKRMWIRSSNKSFRFAPQPLEEGPLVSVVIPARNEEGNLGALLATVLRQTYRTIEVLIVDDESTDATSQIAGDFAERDDRVRLLQAGELPAGWTGKNHACSRGASAAAGEYLLFLDCDVRLADQGAIGGMVDYAVREQVDLYSVIPRQHLSAFAERLLGPAVYSVMGFAFLPLDRVNNPQSPKAAAVGQCMFFRRSAYDQLGGHERLKDHIVEDIDFARLVKSEGKVLALHYGAGDITVRMYTGLAEMWEGWGKNLYRAAAGGPMRLLHIELLLFLAYLAPLLTVVYSAVRIASEPNPAGWVMLALAGAVLVRGHLLRMRKYKAMGWPVRYEPGHEIGAVFALFLLVVSAFKDRRSGAVSWKGRTYAGGVPGEAVEQ